MAEEAKRLANWIKIRHTPKHGSWLNTLGRDLPEQIGGKPALEQHVRAWKHHRNEVRIRLLKLYWIKIDMGAIS